jgi:radical SAM protein with 4Fe4S-binding SPASM domain
MSCEGRAVACETVGPRPWLTAPFKLTVSITTRCNLACSVCYTDCGRVEKPELTTEEWIKVFRNLADEGFITAFIEGGEPFAREDFETILAEVTPRMFASVRTNATLITQERAARLRALRVGRLYVDVFGATPETHDAISGVAGSFEATLAGVRASRAVGLPVTLVMIFNRPNAPELQGFVDLASALGCDEAAVLRLYPLGRAKAHWSELSLSIDEMAQGLAALRVPDGLRLMQSWHPNDNNCCWQNAAVDPHGRSIGCPYLREYVDYGDVVEHGFAPTWQHPLYRTLRSGDVSEACPECERTQLTRGGCRSTAFAYHGRWDAGDPFCTHLNNGTDLRALPQHAPAAQP